MRAPRLGSARREDVRAALVALAALALAVGVLSAVASDDGDAKVVAGAPQDASALPLADGDTASAAAVTEETSTAHDDTAHEHGGDATEAAHDDAEHLQAQAGSDGHAHADGTSDAAHDDSAAHDDGHAHDTTPTVAGSPPTTHGDHAHTDSTPTSAGSPPTTHGDHPHPEPAPSLVGSPPTTAHNHEPTPGPTPGPAPTGPIISLTDTRLTAAQRAAAQSLIDSTGYGMQRFPDVAAVLDAGYTWILDGAGGGFQHYVNWSYLNDGLELDPGHIESVVVEQKANGIKQIASAMYILEPNKTMTDVPEIAGELTTWHNHTNLCWNGNVLAGVAVNGVCRRGVLRVTPPMLHVWMVPHPCGPFAGIEGHGEACGHSH